MRSGEADRNLDRDLSRRRDPTGPGLTTLSRPVVLEQTSDSRWGTGSTGSVAGRTGVDRDGNDPGDRRCSPVLRRMRLRDQPSDSSGTRTPRSSAIDRPLAISGPLPDPSIGAGVGLCDGGEADVTGTHRSERSVGRPSRTRFDGHATAGVALLAALLGDARDHGRRHDRDRRRLRLGRRTQDMGRDHPRLPDPGAPGDGVRHDGADGGLDALPRQWVGRTPARWRWRWSYP